MPIEKDGTFKGRVVHKIKIEHPKFSRPSMIIVLNTEDTRMIPIEFQFDGYTQIEPVRIDDVISIDYRVTSFTWKDSLGRTKWASKLVGINWFYQKS